MARLFLFAIGGTGSRVLKSLTMLLAAGIRPQSPRDYEIVPVIIDPHKSNDDLKRTIRLMDNYQAIVSAVGTGNGFFGTLMTTLNRLSPTADRLSGSFTLGLQQVANTRFSDYIGFNQLPENTKALADLLFSGRSIDKHGDPAQLLDIEMDIGFVGNPNIGSVVLNQFKDSDEFKEIAAQYAPEDRIFIISSIFGGTGAAGFPTILKNIRNAMSNPQLNGKGVLENSRIGAVSVLPYFNLENVPESPINRADFIGKTKAALYYYQQNVNEAVNALYYLTDDFTGSPYKNDPGDQGQQNNAHFIELAAALAVIDFLEIPDQALTTINGTPEAPVYKEFGIRQDAARVRFSDLEDQTEKLIGMPLSQFAFFQKFLQEDFNAALGRQRWSLDEPQLSRQFAEDTFFRSHVLEFVGAFTAWLREMDLNQRGFAPFDLAASLDAMIAGRPAAKRYFSRLDGNEFNNILSKTVKGQTYSSSEQKLVSLFFHATQSLLISNFNYHE